MAKTLTAPTDSDIRERLREASKHHATIATGLVNLARIEAEERGTPFSPGVTYKHLTTAFHSYTSMLTRLLADGGDVCVDSLTSGLDIIGAYNPDAFRLAVVETELYQ
ncbi:hypothetical protein HYX12_02025 [Candidatus Woesearchaeota archaeon]|nr:hypothetical protein [Candidatus Woesearchaeota archaeon]